MVNEESRFFFPSEGNDNYYRPVDYQDTVIVNQDIIDENLLENQQNTNVKKEPHIYVPEFFKDASNIVDLLMNLEDEGSVIIDLSNLIENGALKEEGRRLVDYVCGAVKVLNYTIKKSKAGTLTVYKF